MKIGFFGTPDIAAYCLEKLVDRFEISFVITGEDKAVGRHQHVSIGPVKTLALAKEIPVYQPSRLRDQSLVEQLRNHDADLFVVVAYGKLIPGEIFNLPRLKTINLHPSLLPLYRGAAPVEWSLIRGESVTGITVQMINERLDAGDIVLQKNIPLEPDTTAGELYETVLPLGSSMVIEAIDLLSSGKACPISQDDSKATFCGKIDRDTAHIDWNRPAEEIHNLVRGLNPKPVAWTTLRDRNMKIHRTRLIAPGEVTLAPEPMRLLSAVEAGQIAVVGKKRLFTGTSSGPLEILEIQPETKKIMDAAAFINGFRLVPDERFI